MHNPHRPDVLLGFRVCADGRARAVFLDSNGEPYLLHEDQGRVYGVWLCRDPDPPAVGIAGRGRSRPGAALVFPGKGGADLPPGE